MESYLLPYGTVLNLGDEYPEVPNHLSRENKALILKSHLDNVFMEDMGCIWYVNESLEVSIEILLMDPELHEFIIEWNELVTDYPPGNEQDVTLQLILRKEGTYNKLEMEKNVDGDPEDGMPTMMLDEVGVMRLLKLYPSVRVYDCTERTIWE